MAAAATGPRSRTLRSLGRSRQPSSTPSNSSLDPQPTQPPARDARRRLACWLAVAAPLCWVPGGFTRFGPATLLVVAVAGLLAATTPALGRVPRDLILVALAWSGVLVLAALLGDTPVASLVGRWPRYEGVPVLALYAGAAWIGARVAGPVDDETGVRRLSLALGAMAVALATFSLLDLAGISPVGPGGLSRSGSLLGNATDQGAVAMIAALVVAGPAIRARSPGHLVALAAALTTVAVSGSRAALILTAIGLVVVAGRRWWSYAGVGLVMLGGVALAVPTTRHRLLSTGTGRGRLEQWHLTLDLVRDHPVLGIGPNRYVDAFGAYENASFVRFTGPYQLADSPHSVLLQLLVAGGALLLLTSLIGVVLVARRVGAVVREHPQATPLVVAVVAYLTLLMLNFTAAGPTCLAALLLGAVVAAPAAHERRTAQRVADGRARVVWAVAVVVLVGACLGDVRLQDGIAAADGHDVETAREAFANAGALRPWDSDVALIGAAALAQEATRGGREASAIGRTLARRALARTPDSYQGLVALGVTLLARGELDEALATLEQAVAVAPYRPDGYVQRAIARYGLGDREGALVDLRRAAEIVPRSDTIRGLLRKVELGS